MFVIHIYIYIYIHTCIYVYLKFISFEDETNNCTQFLTQFIEEYKLKINAILIIERRPSTHENMIRILSARADHTYISVAFHSFSFHLVSNTFDAD